MADIVTPQVLISKGFKEKNLLGKNRCFEISFPGDGVCPHSLTVYFIEEGKPEVPSIFLVNGTMCQRLPTETQIDNFIWCFKQSLKEEVE